MYFLIPLTFSSKSTYCQRVSRPYRAEKIQPGGGQVERKKKCATLCIPLEQTLVVKGLGRGLTNKWQEMTDVEETPQRDLMLIGARLWMWQPWYHLSALEATHMERTLYILVILNKQHLQTPDRTPLSALSDLICPSIGGVWVCVKRELREGSWQGWIIRKAQMLDVPTCS